MLDFTLKKSRNLNSWNTVEGYKASAATAKPLKLIPMMRPL